jgi:hypothetical protein
MRSQLCWELTGMQALSSWRSWVLKSPSWWLIGKCPASLSPRIAMLLQPLTRTRVLSRRQRTSWSIADLLGYILASIFIYVRRLAQSLNAADTKTVRDTLGTGIYFMTYESSKQLLTAFRRDKSPTNPLSVVLAGGLCGVASWALIYPIDSAKSIYQRNCLTHCKGEKVSRAPKIQFFNKRMYRGLGVSMGRSCVVNSIFFSAFELIKKNINALED